MSRSTWQLEGRLARLQRGQLVVSIDPTHPADGLVVPGVGAFPAAMQRLRAAGLDELIAARARAGTPVLGLCLGMQLLFDRSVERGGDQGLGLLPGEVVALAPDPPTLKIPHIGWNVVTLTRPSPLTEGLPDRVAFYHVHSFVARPGDRIMLRPVGAAKHLSRKALLVHIGRSRSRFVHSPAPVVETHYGEIAFRVDSQYLGPYPQKTFVHARLPNLRPLV